MLWTAQWADPPCVPWWNAIFLFILLDLDIWPLHYHVRVFCCSRRWWGHFLSIEPKLGSVCMSNCCCRLSGHMFLDLPISGTSFAWTCSFCLSVVWMRKHWIVETLLVVLPIELSFLFLADIFVGHLCIFLLLLLDFYVIALSQWLDFRPLVLIFVALALDIWSFQLIELLLCCGLLVSVDWSKGSRHHSLERWKLLLGNRWHELIISWWGLLLLNFLFWDWWFNHLLLLVSLTLQWLWLHYA